MFGSQLDILRNHLGLTVARMADDLGLNESTLRSVLKGRIKALGPDILGKLSEIYSVNLNWLLTGHGSMFIEKEEKESEGDPEIQRILAVLKRNPELVSAVRRTLETGEDLAQTAAVLADLPKAQRQAILQMIRSMQPEMG